MRHDLYFISEPVFAEIAITPAPQYIPDPLESEIFFQGSTNLP